MAKRNNGWRGFDTNDINIPPFSSTTQIKIDMLTRLPSNEFMQK